MKYLLETSMCVEIIRGKKTRAVDRIARLSTSEFGISTITVAELRLGAEKSSRPAHQHQTINKLLLPLAILDFDLDATLAYGRIRAHLEFAGTPIGALDTLIAAHAVSLDLVLITHNLKEFKRVPKLKAEDWK